MQRDGWRYLQLKPAEVMDMTPREFQNALLGEQERRYDMLEHESMVTLMRRVAYHHDPKKKLQPHQLFDRSKLKREKQEIEEAARDIHAQQTFLDSLDFNGKGGTR